MSDNQYPFRQLIALRVLASLDNDLDSKKVIPLLRSADSNVRQEARRLISSRKDMREEIIKVFQDILKEDKSEKNNKIYINLTALDKITAKTSTFRLAVGENKFFGPLEIKALKCLLSENNDTTDTVAYLQVKDLSNKDNNQVFLFNGWTFASSPTLQSIDHPIYDLWITGCENI